MTKKILIIDDDSQDMKLIKYNLIKHGYENLLFASTGEEGLELARTEKPDLIILDILLPKMNGIEVNNTLQKDPQTRSIPILFNSGLMEEGKAGDAAHIIFSKSPLSSEALVQSIKTILGDL